LLQDRFLKGMQSFGGFYKEHLVNTDLIPRSRLIRWVFGLLGGLLLLAGLILNVSAQALPCVEKTHLHSFRPFFTEQMSSSGSIHPTVRMSGFHKPANIANPIANGDTHGVFCTRCHGVEWDRKLSVNLQSAARQGKVSLSFDLYTHLFLLPVQ
jgi:hypothetical protein